MRKLFSTNDVHPRDRFEYWYDVACREITIHDEVPESRLGFEAEMYTGSLAEIRLISYKTSPRRIARTTRHPRKNSRSHASSGPAQAKTWLPSSIAGAAPYSMRM